MCISVCIIANARLGRGPSLSIRPVPVCDRFVQDFPLVLGSRQRLSELSRATEGLTGSEIENVFVEALYMAFDADREPTDLDIAGVLNDFVPLSKLMAEQITGLRNWAKGRARPATSLVTEKDRRRMLV